jgi:hypothetical protein
MAQEFVLSTTFTSKARSADGHEWTFAAYATDFVERRGRSFGHNKIPYPAKAGSPLPRLPAVMGPCEAARGRYRSYGEFVRNGKTPDEPGLPAVPSLLIILTRCIAAST